MCLPGAALWMSVFTGLHIRLSPSLAGCVWLSGCPLSLHLSPVAGGARLCGCLSSLVAGDSLDVAGGVRLSGCLSSPVALHLFPRLAGGVRLFGCLCSLVSLHVSVDVCLQLAPFIYPGVAGGVRLSGLSSFICFPVWLAVSGTPDVCLQLSPFMCLPVWLVVPGSLDVCLQLPPFICLPVWLKCPALWMSVLGCLFPKQFIVAFPYSLKYVPGAVHMVVSGCPNVSN